MKELLKHWEEAWYADLITFLLAIIGLTISIRKLSQNRKLKPLFFFFLGYVLNQFIVFFDISINVQQPIREIIRRYLDITDTIVEFLAFFFLIKNHITDVKIRKVLNLLLPTFLISIFAYFIYHLSLHRKVNQYFLQVLFTIQAFLLIIASILYYIDLFKTEPKLSLTSHPSFWVVTGLSFFMLSTLPFSIFSLYLIKTNFSLYFQLFDIFEFFYCVLILMIIKAYLCKPVPP
jgi:hypothetical protein